MGTNLGSRRPLTELGAYRLGAYRLGAYRLGQPIWDLSTYSLNWGLQSGAYRLGAYRLGQPIWDLVANELLLKKKYREPFNVNVV